MVIILSKYLDLWFWLYKLMEHAWFRYLVVGSTIAVSVNFTRLNPPSVGIESYPNIGGKFGFALENDSANLQILEKQWRSSQERLYSW